MADIARFWRDVDARDWDGVAEQLTPELAAEWPQSREYTATAAEFLAFESAFPGEWTLELVELRADDRGAVSRIAFTVDGETVTGISFFRFARDGRIASIEEYWPEPYEPPAGQEGRLPRR